jgi:hypothetical protein
MEKFCLPQAQEGVNVPPMKKIILSFIVMAFAVAAQAADTKPTPDKAKEKPSCCAEKVKTSDTAKQETAAEEKTGCGCCKKKMSVKKSTGLASPKAAADARS